MSKSFAGAIVLVVFAAVSATASPRLSVGPVPEPLRLARDPAQSPDGKLIAFSWHGDILVGPLSGGDTRRLPFRGWWTDGTGLNMEGNGAIPDYPVPLAPADESAGEDPQLEKAVRLLLQDLPPNDQLGG